MNDKIKAFMKIIEFISNNVSNKNLQCFPNLETFVTEHELLVENDHIKNIIHLFEIIKTTFKEFCKEDYSELFWVITHLFFI